MNQGKRPREAKIKDLELFKVDDLESLKDLTVREFLDHIEKSILHAVMWHASFSQSTAAELLRISRTTLRKRLERHFGDRFFKISHKDSLDEE